jgi:ketosteroid isomerase-like protein
MDDADPAAALAELRDRAAIADVLAAFCERVDEYDIPALDAVFTPDCTTDYGPGRGGPVAGLPAVQARIARGQAEFRRTHHQLGQSRVRLDGDTAEATTYVTATHEHRDGARSRVHLRYLDRLRRTPDGWRIAGRTVAATVVEGMAGTAWVWVPRGEPEPAGAVDAAVRRFLAAVESGDPDAVAGCFTDDARYANVPHPPAVGPAAIRALFARVLDRCERVRWDVVSAASDGDRAWLERVDRFWIDGREYAIECNGVYTVDPARGQLAEVRDYVDLATWRERLGDVLDRPGAAR